jgi:hypothetical protein
VKALPYFPISFMSVFLLPANLYDLLCPYRFFKTALQVDPDSIWLDLCLESDKAKNYCRLFLRRYVEKAKRKFLVLGPQEYEYRRALNSAASVMQCWRSLIAKADSTVLSAKRRQDPKNRLHWRLKFVDQERQRGQGPIFEISKVSLVRLLRAHGYLIISPCSLFLVFR